MPTRASQSSEEQKLRWENRRQQVGARIRELRLSLDLSQEALALESGLSRNMIIGIEWGRKSVAYERLWDIAEVLDVPVNQLLLQPDSTAKNTPYRGGRRPMGG
jgi:transcriptional regulator with XRE-family HTH domain